MFLSTTFLFAGQGESKDHSTAELPPNTLCSAHYALVEEVDCTATHVLGSVLARLDCVTDGEASPSLSVQRSLLTSFCAQDGLVCALYNSCPARPPATAAVGHSQGSLNAVSLAAARALPFTASLITRCAAFLALITLQLTLAQRLSESGVLV